MRLHSLPFTKGAKRAIYNGFHPGNLNPDEKTIDNYDLCTGRGNPRRRGDIVGGGRNTVLRAPASIVG